MPIGTFFCAGTTPALGYARKFLEEAGVPVSGAPGWDTRHLLLDVPSFRPGAWTPEVLDTLLSSLPADVTLWGGDLDHPALGPYKTVDLLKDEDYLQENAAITADCAIPIARDALDRPWPEVHALVIGWGRIGKALSKKLKGLGCRVTVASRCPEHRQTAEALGFSTMASPDPAGFQLIVNTAPAHVLRQEDGPSVKIDLASVQGITGKDVIWARGLPGRYAPERSGALIADTVLRLLKEVC